MRKFIDQVFIRTLTNLVRIGYPTAMLIAIDWLLALLALSVIPGQWLVTVFLQRRLTKVTRRTLTARSELTLNVKESLDGAETIQCLNGEEIRHASAEKRIEAVERLNRQATKITALIRAVVWTATGIGVALVWWRGSLMVVSGSMSLGTLIVFTGFMEYAYRPFRFFPKVVKSFEQGRASLDRIHQLLQCQETSDEAATKSDLVLDQGRIEFHGVCMNYRGEPVLKDIDLRIEPRQLTAIVGPSGSGKSTLLRMISRLYEKDSGKVLIDGQSIDDTSLNSLRSQIAFVPQTPKFFCGTILENLTIGNASAIEAEVVQKCLESDAWEFIERLPQGLNTRIGPEGIELSGGQAQRLAIARALINGGQILLLDEPTSALDARSQEQVMETVLKLKESLTIVIVGHRVSTFSVADRIVLLNAGQVAAIGSHAELMQQSSDYYRVVNGKSEDLRDKTPATCKAVCA